MRRETWALLACIAASSLVGFDVGMIPVALPNIQADLGGELAAQLWIGSASLLTLGAFLLIGGVLGDVFDRWRLFRLGVMLFGTASLFSGIAPNNSILIVGRLFQGLTAAIFLPAILANLRQTFQGEALQRALGSWTAWTSLLAIAGPPLAGIIVDRLTWRVIFAVEVVLVIGVVYMIGKATPAQTRTNPRPIDWIGGLLLASSIGGILYGLIEGPVRGWGSSPIVGAIVTGIALFVIFIGWESRVSSPLLPLRLFQIRAFTGINIATFLLYAVFGATGYFITLFLQQVGGYSPVAAGFAVAPTFLVLFLGEEITNRYVNHLPPRLAITIGIVICVAANFLYLNIKANASYVTTVLPGAALYGVGLVLVVSPLTVTALNTVDEHDAGIASGINNAIARIASALGLALLGAILTVTFTDSADEQLADIDDESVTYDDKKLQQYVFGVPPLADVAPDARVEVERAFIEASEEALHTVLGVCGLFLATGGIVCLTSLPSHQAGFSSNQISNEES